jgi:CRP/FNR family transcriptional regulator, cyclic AMP receptor protein
MDTKKLGEIPLFSTMSRHDRKDLARHVEEIEIPEGREIVKKGWFAYEFYAISEGTAEVLDGDQHLQDLGPGDFFGEIALRQPAQSRMATVVAKSPMKLVVMTDQDYRGMRRAHPHVAEILEEAIAERLATPHPGTRAAPR